jgi:hypothetical protein
MPTQTIHTNKLINEKSPYLLQHAQNPVDWYPWGDEGFNKAKSDDNPVSIHWLFYLPLVISKLLTTKFAREAVALEKTKADGQISDFIHWLIQPTIIFCITN